MAAGVEVLVDGKPYTAPAAATVLTVCREAGVYVPALCAHPAIPADGVAECGDCDICLVDVAGRIERACSVRVEAGMAITTRSDSIESLRKERLAAILAHHPHDCLSCPERDGCDRTECTHGLPPQERCCERFNTCEIQQVAYFVGISPDTPRYRPTGLASWCDDPALRLDLERCIGCQRCVAVCHEVEHHHALAAIVVGDRLLVQPAKSGEGGGFKDSDCRFCGACVEVCPAGAIVEHGRQATRWRQTTHAKLAYRPVPLPPGRAQLLDRVNVAAVPDVAGVYRLRDAHGNVILIEGSPALRASLLRELEARADVATFDFEEAAMYTQRANELLAHHLKEFNRLPAGNDLADDLF